MYCVGQRINPETKVRRYNLVNDSRLSGLENFFNDIFDRDGSES